MKGWQKFYLGGWAVILLIIQNGFINWYNQSLDYASRFLGVGFTEAVVWLIMYPILWWGFGKAKPKEKDIDGNDS